MKRVMKFTATLLIVLLCGCAKNRHIGTWEADMDQREIILTFNPKTIFTSVGGFGPATNSYTIDYRKNPIWLDVIVEEKPIKCILEFLDDNTFKILQSEGSKNSRPTSFKNTKEVLVFKRKK